MGIDFQTNGLAALSGTFLFLTFGSVVLRFVARYKQKGRVWMDDYTIAVAWVGFVGLVALSFFGLGEGFLGNTTPKDKALVQATAFTQGRTLISFDVLTALTLGMTKLSAVCFYRRIFCFGSHRDALNCITMIFIFLVLVWTVTFIVVPLSLCGPLKCIDRDIRHATQFDRYASYFKGFSVSDSILDVAVLVLPLPKIWSLNITTARKIAVSCVFLIALVGLGASTARLVIMMRLVHKGRAGNAKDRPQASTQIVYYAVLEAAFSIVAINGPSLWYIVASNPLGRILQSIRSIVSFAPSHRPNSSKRSVERVTRDAAMGHKLDVTDSSPSSPAKGSVETYVMADLNVVPAAKGSRGGILVDHL
ncbi:hypothetical protein VFPPC_14778 [Pochonia chlamydosporia 170]|uniref:Rhodopsin domain-containing protein n=1 Tax=Pochonia chlamydosporia 170 TaxID=1380566 RepID=A0A179F1Y8_METCM|nr:hypothetical protein VFPPC_14778 [Pochonia chlamydosporia 170]OAQ59465.2 hypothetical protein VFPPC_14778 [Pochonia chlamydosporia 170]